MRAFMFILLFCSIVFGQFGNRKIFLRIKTDVKFAELRIYENAISPYLYNRYKNNEIKRDEMDVKTAYLKKFTTPVASIMINPNQIIRIVLKKKGYRTFDKFFKIGDRDVTIDASDFRPKSKIKLFFKNLLIPGWGQFHTDRGGAGFGFMALETIILGGAGYLYYDKEFVHYKKFKDYRSQYQAASDPALYQELSEKMNKEKDIYDKEHTYFTYALYAAGAVWAWAFLDGFINAPGPNDRYTVHFKMDNWDKKYYACISIKF